MRILLVEDDRLLGLATRHGLEQDGFRVDWATDGNVASVATKTQRYDVIVLDLGLPGVSGDQLLRTWRAYRERTPIVVLTARALGNLARQKRGILSLRGINRGASVLSC
jgi:DNA-binding response OmpR family regulator